MTNVEIKNETTHVDYLNGKTETGPEYLRRIANDIRDGGQSQTAFDIEAAADKIDELEGQIKTKDQRLVNADLELDYKTTQLNEFSDGIMGLIGDKVDQLIDKRLDDAIREELENFDIRAYEYEITDMINETLPDEKDEDEQREQVEEIVKAVLSGATISIDI